MSGIVSVLALQSRFLERMSLTFSVVAEAHLGLAETNGVFALADAIELLELCLVDALHATRQPPMALEGEMFGR
jgi:hypothetical protein